MAITNKVQLPVAVNSSSKLDISSTHITTGSFMQFRPFYYRHVIPGEHLKGSVNVLSRLAPLQVPTYGRCRINCRGWFVPFRLVFPNFDSFITDTIANNYSYSSLVASSPIFPNSAILDMFTSGAYFGNALATAITGWNTGDPYDFAYGSPVVHYELTYYGRAFMTILNSMGYRMCLGDLKNHDFNYSALGLLCLARIYADWYTNDQYKNSSDYLALMRLFKYNDPTANLTLNWADLNTILSFLLVVIYDGGKDVFVNAWDNPVAPNSGNFTSFQGNDITLLAQGNDPNLSTSTFVDMASNGTPFMNQNAATVTRIGSEYLHSFLKATTDFMKRNQLSGAAECDRFLSRFGINLDSSKLDRSVYVCEKSIDVDFGSVMSQADTSGVNDPSNLGDYAGVGLGRGNMQFDYKCNDFGIFILTYSIIPSASLYQGFDRNNLHISKMDFFQPEYDQLGCSAISTGEVYVSKNTGYANPDDYKKIWGFAPRLYEYKQKQDFVTGDYVFMKMQGGDAWHMNRELDDATFNNSVANQVHSLGFTRGHDAGIYDRVFQYTTPDMDKFYLVFHVAAETIAPCKSLVDTYDFESNAKKITLHSNGAKVN